MSQKGGKQQNRGAADPQSVEGLLRALADRERQLRDLTEQSLGFLEELAESRRRNHDRDRLAERLGELERTLADTRRRLRHAGGSAPDRAADDGSPTQALEVVCWGEDARARAAALRNVCGDVPVAWVGLPQVAATGSTADGPRAILHRDAHTPAQSWNLGMAASRAEVVMFLGPGTSSSQAPALPPIAGQANVALLCPRVERGAAAELGNDEADPLLRLRPRPAPAADSDPVPVPFPSCDAFLVRRAAFERIGSFDEGLLGPATLIDYTLRARTGNLEVYGVPSLVVRGPARGTDAAEPAVDERERLAVVATFRGDQLGRALADAHALWNLEPAAASTFLAGLLSRLPAAEDLGAQRAVLDRIVLGLVEHGLPVARLCGLLLATRLELLGQLYAADFAPTHEQVAQAFQRAQHDRCTTAADAFAALAQDVALDHRVRTAMLQALAQERAERCRLDTEFHAQLARAERAEGARNAATEQLHQTEQHVQRLEQERLEAARRLQEQSDAAAQREQQLAQERARTQQTESALQQERRNHEQLTHEHEANVRRQQELAHQLEATERRLHELHGELAGIAHTIAPDETHAPAQLQQRVVALQVEAELLASTLHAAGVPDANGLLDELKMLRGRVAAAEQSLAERDRWIALLLQEVGRRRLFPRQLLEHERALLQRVGRAP